EYGLFRNGFQFIEYQPTYGVHQAPTTNCRRCLPLGTLREVEMLRALVVHVVALLVAPAAAVFAQYAPGHQGTSNLQVIAHLPLGRMFTVGDVEVEQELARPYAYVPRVTGRTRSAGFSIIGLPPGKVGVLYTWRIENPELHAGLGGSDGEYFKLRGRY